MLGGSPCGGRANASTPGLVLPPYRVPARWVAAFTADAFFTAADEGLPWALAGPACRVLLVAVSLWRHLWIAMRQLSWRVSCLLAAGLPCVVGSTSRHMLGGRCRRVAALGSRR